MFASVKKKFSKILTKRSRAILRPFLESQSFGHIKIILTILESPFSVENVCFFSELRKIEKKIGSLFRSFSVKKDCKKKRSLFSEERLKKK